MSDSESESTGAKVIFQPLVFQQALNGAVVNETSKQNSGNNDGGNLKDEKEDNAKEDDVMEDDIMKNNVEIIEDDVKKDDITKNNVEIIEDDVKKDVIKIDDVKKDVKIDAIKMDDVKKDSVKKNLIKIDNIKEDNVIEINNNVVVIDKENKLDSNRKNDNDVIMLDSGNENETKTRFKKEVGESDPAEKAQIDTDKQMKYRIWKKNTPVLYSLLQTSTLLWPSLTIEWFPDVEMDRSSIELCKVNIPSNLDKLTLEDCTYDPEREEFFASELPEVGDQAKDENTKCKGPLQVVQEIPHEGDINKARLMPQNPDLIATMSNSGTVCIFDRTKKPNSFDLYDLTHRVNGEDEKGGMADIQLKFHMSEGWGLDWNKNKEGELVTGSNDGMIAVWDIRKPFRIQAKTTSSLSATRQKKFRTCVLKPAKTRLCHDYGVNSVKYSVFHDSLVGTAGEDGLFKLFDTRILASKPVVQFKVGTAINALDFNKNNEFAVALGDDHGNIYIEDLRSPEAFQITLSGAHAGAITGLEWNSSFGNVLASGSEDGCVRIWKFGANSSTQDPKSSLIFTHSGHMLGVSDISWNPADPKMIASCSEDNSVHIWKPSAAIF
ncbi:hypothetical protein BRETT_004367 [Brettanomyces bruxellensis]|uniref:Histone-binding protein RBBP4-like N-terminal domain-containing protein n=1 Tax=Dekkera bruxellensis TaxID=5007 RepID=A0A871R1X5_DEKBR|nr:uncharacterized protein BRETT_004367 [Brettanomyces bruxellensis]QOU19146.1 hypothetical protein BRETT_004367 [Brettanomyces bruxellensis]